MKRQCTNATTDRRVYLGLRAEIRRAASLEIGDTVHVELERDDAPRVVEVPEALRQALDSDPVATALLVTVAALRTCPSTRALGEAGARSGRPGLPAVTGTG